MCEAKEWDCESSKTNTEYVVRKRRYKKKTLGNLEPSFFSILYSPHSAFFPALFNGENGAHPVLKQTSVTNSNHTMSELSCLWPPLQLGWRAL